VRFLAIHALFWGKEIQFAHDADYPCSADNGFIEFEVNLRCVFQDNSFRKKVLKVASSASEL
jgi:hypothetical protein